MFQILPDSIAAALEIMKPERPASAVVELDEEGQLVESRLHPEAPTSSLMKRNGAVFCGKPIFVPR